MRKIVLKHFAIERIESICQHLCCFNFKSLPRFKFKFSVKIWFNSSRRLKIAFDKKFKIFLTFKIELSKITLTLNMTRLYTFTKYFSNFSIKFWVFTEYLLPFNDNDNDADIELKIHG